jgi:quercetin dioxygenase-like cupin family protein
VESLVSVDVKNLASPDSTWHIGYVISGRVGVRTKDGTEVEVGPGDAFVVAPGHDAWVVGNEPCVALDVIPTGGT